MFPPRDGFSQNLHEPAEDDSVYVLCEHPQHEPLSNVGLVADQGNVGTVMARDANEENPPGNEGGGGGKFENQTGKSCEISSRNAVVRVVFPQKARNPGNAAVI